MSRSVTSRIPDLQELFMLSTFAIFAIVWVSPGPAIEVIVEITELLARAASLLG